MTVQPTDYPVIRRLGDSTIVSTHRKRPAVVRRLEDAHIQGNTDPERRAHFTERAEAWLSVGPHITPLFTATLAPAGHRLLVSKLEKGRSLATLRRASARPMSPGEIADLLLPASTLVDTLHRQGIGHGRLRPETLILRHSRRKTQSPFVLVDFDCAGIAPALGRSSAFFHPREGRPIQRDLYSLSAIAFHLSRMAPSTGRPAHQVLLEGRVPPGCWRDFLETVLTPGSGPSTVAEWQTELTRAARPCATPW